MFTHIIQANQQIILYNQARERSPAPENPQSAAQSVQLPKPPDPRRRERKRRRRLLSMELLLVAILKLNTHYLRAYESMNRTLSAFPGFAHADWNLPGVVVTPEMQVGIPDDELEFIRSCTNLVNAEFKQQVILDKREEIETLALDRGFRYITGLHLLVKDICDTLRRLTEGLMVREEQKYLARNRNFYRNATNFATGWYLGRAKGLRSPLRTVTNASDFDLMDIIDADDSDSGDWEDYIDMDYDDDSEG
ncbi:hypothetical protein F5Y09DRAFT_343436 [Xylaria sp. FL1042]|nr:hypothetical protein F5Y09DRAFT_343436 [Xylaria sp. FL1042]